MTPLVSVVIPFYNRAKDVDRCLGSVLRQKPPFDFEIIAIDNDSSDGTLEQLDRHPVRVLSCSRRGASAARNAGIEAAAGSIIAFTDSDCVAARDWLERLVAPMLRDPSITATGGTIRGLRRDSGAAWFLAAGGSLDQRQFFDGTDVQPPFFATANCAMRRASIVGAGGFDESLRVCEDADLCWRVFDRGGRIAWVRDAVVLHDHRRSFDALWKMAVDYGEATVALFARHRGRFAHPFFIDWKNWRALGEQPFRAAWRILAVEHPVGRKWFVYESLWLTGYTLGKLRGALKHRVLYI